MAFPLHRWEKYGQRSARSMQTTYRIVRPSCFAPALVSQRLAWSFFSSPRMLFRSSICVLCFESLVFTASLAAAVAITVDCGWVAVDRT